MLKLKRHPLAIRATLRRTFVLTYAYPAERLRPLLTPGLSLDEHGGYGLAAVAMVQTERLRPAALPSWCGASFFLAGIRIFVRYRNSGGKNLRGLQVLGSLTDSRTVAWFGNRTTHYGYRLASGTMDRSGDMLAANVELEGRIFLSAQARLGAAELPAGSVFADAKVARRFAGPMPFTFAWEKETHSVVVVQGVRSGWEPRLVLPCVQNEPDLSTFGIDGPPGTLSSAFHLEDVPYRWERGVVEKLAE